MTEITDETCCVVGGDEDEGDDCARDELVGAMEDVEGGIDVDCTVDVTGSDVEPPLELEIAVVLLDMMNILFSLQRIVMLDKWCYGTTDGSRRQVGCQNTKGRSSSSRLSVREVSTRCRRCGSASWPAICDDD